MASHQTLQATKREQAGTGVAKKLRRDGIIPAIIYGADQDNYTIQLKSKDFGDLLKRSTSDNFLVNLEIEGAKEKTKLAMVQEVQIKPLTGAVIHVDFHAVKEDQVLSAHLPIELTGEPEGVKTGGILEHLLRSIEVHCRPADLPEKLVVDISYLELDQALHVSDLPFPDGVEVTMDGGVVVAMVAASRAAVSDGEDGEAAPTEGGQEASEGGEEAAS
ncbi:MAG: 50S ribosomal protein L25 [Verrucomicrobiales bacterium]|nr:50S ribosomal protein L25 [Verrucomicrobiales bacterium]